MINTCEKEKYNSTICKHCININIFKSSSLLPQQKYINIYLNIVLYNSENNQMIPKQN